MIHTVSVFFGEDDRKVRICVRKKNVGKKNRYWRRLPRTLITFI